MKKTLTLLAALLLFTGLSFTTGCSDVNSDDCLCENCNCEDVCDCGDECNCPNCVV